MLKAVCLSAGVLLFAGVLPARSGDAPSLAGLGGTLRPVVQYFQGDRVVREVPFDLCDGARVTETNGAEWALALEMGPVGGQPDARDYRFTWTLARGEVKAAAVGVAFDFKPWSPTNFVFVPAAVYDGNRFDVKPIGYPPYWYSTNQWRLDMPTTIVDCPTLGRGPGPGRMDFDTGNASTPLMAFQDPVRKLGWMVQTTQGSRFGNHGLCIEEGAGRATARFAITAPAVRAARAAMTRLVRPSGDRPADWKTGDTLTIACRVYVFPSRARGDLLRRFAEVRKDLNPAVRSESLPFGEARKLLTALYRDHRWDERIGMFWLTDPAAANTGWNFIWQLGWCGGGQVTLPLLMCGDAVIRQRALRNLDVIFAKSQAASGFFNTIGNGEAFASFGFSQNFKHHESLIRSQGDWLYMAQRQFRQIESGGGTVPAPWRDGLRKLADAFVRLWDKRGQFGQFVNVETGDLCIGGSTCGGIAPGGLALAARTYATPRYLAVAEAAARQYHRDWVRRGYTTGGPGEILSAPDAESAFGLFESFMALYEVTGATEWLGYAGELLPICASWTVSYDYRFPADSPMGRIQAQACGAVWASVQNMHAAPGICTWSGDSLLKYYRATGDRLALDLLTDIAHGITQYISRADRPIGNLPPGGVCERVNLSDWEGRQHVGGNIFASCSWCETAALLTVTQLPGLYVQPDTGVYAAFDSIRVERVSHARGVLKLRLANPAACGVDVAVRVESSAAARQPAESLVGPGVRTIRLDAGAVTEVAFP